MLKNKKEKFQKKLVSFGIPANLAGFQYILDAMEVIELDKTYACRTMDLYQAVADRKKVSAMSVEHAIRTAVKKGNYSSDPYMKNITKLTSNCFLATLYISVSDC